MLPVRIPIDGPVSLYVDDDRLGTFAQPMLYRVDRGMTSNHRGAVDTEGTLHGFEAVMPASLSLEELADGAVVRICWTSGGQVHSVGGTLFRGGGFHGGQPSES